MKDKASSFIKLLFVPLWLLCILTIISTITLILVFLKGMEDTPIAYVIYVLSFYTLSVDCIACAHFFPKYYKLIKQKIYDNKISNRYMTDVTFKTHINLYRSLAVNLLYVAVNLFSGIFFGTAWFMLFAGYYMIMAVMRFLLLRYINKTGIGKNRLGELKRARLCAFILVAVNLSLSGAVLMMVSFNRGFEYYGILIYVMAVYTFYITTAAIINIVKYKKYNSPIMSMAKSINLASALVSMLSLETAMFSQFGEESSPEARKIMICATGAGICAVVLYISIHTIWKTSKEIKKESANNGKQ